MNGHLTWPEQESWESARNRARDYASIAAKATLHLHPELGDTFFQYMLKVDLAIKK